MADGENPQATVPGTVPGAKPGVTMPPTEKKHEEGEHELHNPHKHKIHGMRVESKWVVVGGIIGFVLGTAFGYFRGHDAKGIAIAGGVGLLLGAGLGIAAPARGLKHHGKDSRGFDSYSYCPE